MGGKSKHKNVSGHPLDVDGVVLGTGEFGAIDPYGEGAKGLIAEGLLVPATEPEKAKGTEKAPGKDGER